MKFLFRYALATFVDVQGTRKIFLLPTGYVRCLFKHYFRYQFTCYVLMYNGYVYFDTMSVAC